MPIVMMGMIVGDKQRSREKFKNNKENAMNNNR